MPQNNSDILFRLKQKPRHGQTGPEGEEAKRAERERIKRLKDYNDALRTTGLSATKLSEITVALTKDQTNLQAGIATSISIMDKYGTAIKNSAKNATYLEQRNKELATTFGLSSKQAGIFGQKLDNLSKGLGIGGNKLRDYAKSLKDVTAGFIATDKPLNTFQKNMLKSATYMQNNLKLNEEAAQGYELYSALIADSSANQLVYQSNISTQIERATGLMDVQRDLTETIGGLSADIQLQYSRIPGALELAVLKSRALGLSMENLHSTGKSLLNIESSIGSELEYQLLSGRRLVDQQGNSLTNAYREATLRGDASKQADILNRILEQEGDVLQNNLFARQQMSDLLGIDEATLSRSLQKKQILERIGGETLMNLTGEELRAAAGKLQGVVQGDIEKLMEIDDMRTTDEHIADTLDNIYTAMIGQGQADIISGTRAELTKGVQGLFAGGTLGDLQTSLQAQQQLLGNLQQYSTATYEVIHGFTSIIEVLPVLGSTLSSTINKVGDEITKLRNLNTITTEVTPAGTAQDALIMNDGIIKFHPADSFMRVNDSTMIAGTNVDGNKKLARAITGGGGVSKADLQQLAGMIVAGMKGLNLTVKADPTFSGNSLNGAKRF